MTVTLPHTVTALQASLAATDRKRALLINQLKEHMSWAVISRCYGLSVFKEVPSYADAVEIARQNNSTVDRDMDKYERDLLAIVGWEWPDGTRVYTDEEIELSPHMLDFYEAPD